MRMRNKLFLLALKRKTFILTLFSIAALVLIGAGIGSVVADDSKDLSCDPLNDAWKSRIVPKHRVNISYMDTSWNIQTFRGQGEGVSSDLHVTGAKIPTNVKSELFNNTVDGNNDNRIFAMASSEGQVLGNVTLSADILGWTSFSNVPRGIVFTAYLYMMGGQNNGTTMLCVEATAADGRRVRANMSDAPKPAFICEFNADGSWVNGPPLDMNVCTEVVACDWNKDGYTDYVVSYISNSNGKPIGNGRGKITLAYIDGKSFWECGNDYKNITRSYNAAEYFSDESDMVGGLTDVKPPNSMRTAIGDFNADGKKEIALYHTRAKAVSGLAHDNSLFIYSVASTPSKSDPKETAVENVLKKEYAEYTKVGQSYLQNDSVGIAAADIDGDGADEIALICATAKALYRQSTVYVRVMKASKNLTEWSKPILSVEIGQTFDVLNTNGTNYSMPPIDAELVELDGDGVPELVWYTVTSQHEHRTTLFVTKFNVNNGNISYGNTYSTNINDLGFRLHDNYMRYSLACGTYNYPTDTVGRKAVYSLPKQIGITQLGSDGHLDWAVFSWNSAKGFTLLGKAAGNSAGGINDAMGSDMIPFITAADIDNESMILGNPTVISVYDDITTSLIMQTPPKHWDRVLAKDSSLSAMAEEDGCVTIDGFAAFAGKDDSSTYNTSFRKEQSYGTAKSKVTTSDGSFGIQPSFEMQHRETLLDKMLDNQEDDPLLSLGAHYAVDVVSKNTNTQTFQATLKTEAGADRDDVIYCTTNSSNICRYPVLFPASKRYVTVSDDEGKEYPAQNYLQLIVPVETTNEFMPTSGRKISWYEPMHDPYNLFTYPKQLKDISGYPVGTEAKKAINPDDPWQDINGKVFMSQAKMTIGEGNPSTPIVNVVSETSKEDLSSIKHACGGNVNFHPSFGIVNKYEVKVDLTGDYTWQSDSMTKTDASTMTDITLNWPGAATYLEKSVYRLQDLQFDAGVAFYTQDDGTLCVSYSVPKLSNINSCVWGGSGPFHKYPDPGFVLPFRWATDLKKNSEDNPFAISEYYLVENNSKYQRYQLRGLKITGKGKNLVPTSAEIQEIPMKLLEVSKDYTISLRVVNYSFVPVSRDLTVKFYYQPWKNASDLPEPVDNPKSGDCTLLGSVDMMPIAGRSDETLGPDNWCNAIVNVKAPAKPSLGWLHAVIEYKGTQLNTKNDHGYTLIGVYNPANTVTKDMSTASDGTSVELAARPDLLITQVQAYEITANTSGDITYTPVSIDASSRYKKLKVDVTVRYTGGSLYRDGVVCEAEYLPYVYGTLCVGKNNNFNALLDGDQLPLMKSGQEYTFSHIYDPKDCNVSDGAAVRVFSQLLPASEQKIADNQTVVLWKALSNGSGSGGCNSGLGLWLLALPAMFAIRRKRK